MHRTSIIVRAVIFGAACVAVPLRTALRAQQTSTALTAVSSSANKASSAQTLNLMPVPRSLSIGQGRLRIDASFHVAVIRHTDARLQAAVARMLPRLEHRTALALSRNVARSPLGATLIIDCAAPGEAVQSINENESYTIDADDRAIILRAPTSVGVIRGLETVLQLVDADSAGFFVPAVSIQDAPRFAWRGLLVDVSRHFEPVEEIERTLDGMAAVKLNVLHWHLSDDQGFRVQSRRYPRLQKLGSDGHYYTQRQIREIVAYARARGIRVVPEFDMPGHASSWFVGYPRYASAPGPYRIGRRWSGYDAVFDPTRRNVYRFVDGFVGEMTTLFPDAYWHIGGDEVNAKQWKGSPHTQAFMKAHHLADEAALQAYFNQRLSRILTKHHRRMIGWDEILHPDLPRATVVQSWRGTKYLDQAVTQGFNGILSAPYYLDAMKSAEEHYAADPIPANSDLTPEQAARVLGGEACMWAELITPETIDSRVWPRMAAIAERFWSPREVTNVPDMYRRLAVESVLLEQVGLDHVSHTDRFLRRIASGPDIAPLSELLAFAEPVTLGQRIHGQPTVQMTPLVFMVDAAVPDPPSKHTLRELVSRAMTSSRIDTAARDSLARLFNAWRELAPRVHTVVTRAPLAQGGIQAANALAVAGIIGQAGLDAIVSAKPLPKSWVDSALVTLQALDKPQGVLHLTVIPAVRQLLVPQS